MQVARNVPHPATILLVEDNPSDIHIARAALEETTFLGELHVVEDGDRALDFLKRRDGFAMAPRPDLVLLDLNLPGRDGRQVLREIKSDAELHRIPVIVLTTSTAPSDVVECYDLHANCYIAKPVDFDRFAAVLREIESFWLRWVTLPPE
ncbi:MAG: response regulator [Gemmatimonadota bacterium]|nr:response regulator [Gemmatimonadota bacterium]